MFAEIEKEYYSTADLIFLFYHGFPESAFEAEAKAKRIQALRPEAPLFLLRNITTGTSQVAVSDGLYLSLDFDPSDHTASLNLFHTALETTLHSNNSFISALPGATPSRRPCVLL